MREHPIIDLELSRELNAIKETVEIVVSYLKQMGFHLQQEKTWTSDAIYRGNP